jgi:hypothetical protein
MLYMLKGLSSRDAASLSLLPWICSCCRLSVTESSSETKPGNPETTAAIFFDDIVH